MRTETPRRPAWNHEDVKTKAALEIYDDVYLWARIKKVVEEDVDEKQLRALIVLALREAPDSYLCGRYLEDFYQWPVDYELVKHLDAAYARTKYIVRDFVHAWVTEHNIRFPAKKGMGVRFRIKDSTEMVGKVEAVVRAEARAIVSVSGNNIGVNAEDVIEAFKLKDEGPKPNPPTGGTPVAMVVGGKSIA